MIVSLTICSTSNPSRNAPIKCHFVLQTHSAEKCVGTQLGGSYLRSRWGRGCCCWRVMKVVPHTGLLWLFLSQPTGGEDGYGVLRNPWSDSVSAVRDEAELPITTVRSKLVSENTLLGTFWPQRLKRDPHFGEKQTELGNAKETAWTAIASQVFVVAFIRFPLNGKKLLVRKQTLWLFENIQVKAEGNQPLGTVSTGKGDEFLI